MATTSVRLAFGSRGDTVAMVQKRLQELGHFPRSQKRTGYFGTVTKAAVIAFQKHTWPHDKKQWDGVVGPKTWAAMFPPTPKKRPVADFFAALKARLGGYTPIWSMSQSTKLKKFGDKADVRGRIVKIIWRGKTFWLIDYAAPRVHAFFDAVADYEKANGLPEWKPRQVGSWVWRLVRGAKYTLSSHCWAAIDFNWDANPMTSDAGRIRAWNASTNPEKIPAYVIKAAKATGARWGGDYRTRKDYMHFEW